MKKSVQDLSEVDRSQAPLSYSFWLGTFVIRGSVAPRVIIDVAGFGLLAAVIVYAVRSAERHFGIDLSVPAAPFEAAGAVLGLLLVLRVNAGYSRWWEARVLWGGIVNQSRNLAIAALAYGPKETAWRSRFIRWLAAFPHVVRRSLRGQREFPELDRLLTVDRRAWVEQARHMPDAVASELALMLAEARRSGMDGFAFQEAERQRGKLIDYIGGCERILKTPLARSGAIQVRQFIFLFLVTLPFALIQDLEEPVAFGLLHRSSVHELWLVSLFVMLLAYPLVSLDRIGMELQNPFSTRRIDYLPLDSICTTIEENVLELLHEIEEHSPGLPAIENVKLPPDARDQEDVGNFDIS